ncbi:uncharacterized protein ACR2FA_011402 [Aphomia sociella]
MGNSQDTRLKAGHSHSVADSSEKLINADSLWKSDTNLAQSKHISNTERCMSGPNFSYNSKNENRKYYKRYEYDEVPVKDYSNLNDHFVNDLETGDNGRVSLTNSELERIEKKVYKNISQELQTESSITSLEPNIKFFKTTVQEIFDNFYTTMRDFELYKKKFHEILAKNQTEQITDMEDFIKDMIQHIMSSDSCNENNKLENQQEISSNNIPCEIKLETGNRKLLESLHSVVEAFKNENYLNDSTVDNNSKVRNCTKKEEIFNIYLLSGTPYVQIKMNDRNLLSEINIKDPSNHEHLRCHVASAENLKKITAKKMELEQYVKQQHDVPEIDIPIKVSFAKKNIPMNEDFTTDKDEEDNKSFMAKICSFICRKFRKNSFA